MKQLSLWTLLLGLFLGTIYPSFAQTQKTTQIQVFDATKATPSSSPTTPDIKQLHQIYLDRPANKLHQIEYHDGTPLRGRLSPDRMRIYIENYEKRGRIVAKLTYKGSKAPEELKRSSCFIDPVPEF